MSPAKAQGELSFDPETGLCVPVAVIWTIYMTIFVDSMSTSISNPVMPFYARSFNKDARAIGKMYGATSLVGFFGIPLMSKMNDVWGRRPVLLLASIGAGITGMGQAFAPTFPVLCLFRACSGIFTAVASVAQVYVADVSTPEALPGYMAKLASVPNFSRTFGPGLGGFLSKLGMGVPIFVDAVLCFVLAALIYAFVPESPAFLSRQAKSTQPKESAANKSNKPKGSATVPWSAYTLGVAQFFNGIQIGFVQSMLAISMKAKFNWDALAVGYLGVATAIVVFSSTTLFAPRTIKWLGAKKTVSFGSCVIACGFVLMGGFDDPVSYLGGNAVRSFGMGLRQGAVGTLQAQNTNPSNRGVVFGRIQMFNMTGQFLGPIIGGYIAHIDAKGLLWWVAAGTTLIGALLVLLNQVDTIEKKGEPLLQHVAEESQGKQVADDDNLKLGQFMAQLLERKGHNWVSKQEEVKQLLEACVPESLDAKRLELLRHMIPNDSRQGI